MVECDGLENRWARERLVGSNPTPSASAGPSSKQGTPLAEMTSMMTPRNRGFALLIIVIAFCLLPMASAFACDVCGEVGHGAIARDSARPIERPSEAQVIQPIGVTPPAPLQEAAVPDESYSHEEPKPLHIPLRA